MVGAKLNYQAYFLAAWGPMGGSLKVQTSGKIVGVYPDQFPIVSRLESLLGRLVGSA